MVGAGAVGALAGTVGGQTPPPGVAVAAGFVSGSRTIFDLNLAATPLGEFPTNLRVLKGTMTVVQKDGMPMLKATSDSEFRIETLNRTIAECRAENPKMATYKLNWNDTVERRDSGLRRLTLLRRPEDQAS